MQQLKEQERKEVREQQDDEIDLAYFFRATGRLLDRLRAGFIYLLQTVKRYFTLIVILVAIGVSLGFYFFSTTKQYYTSTMTLVLADIRNEFVEGQLNILTQMIEEDNYEAISNNLDIGIDAASQIKKMSFNSLDQERINEDSILTGAPFRIELTLYDSRLFSTMEPALTSYLENNTFFSKQKRIRQRQIENMIIKLKDQISSIDSVKTTVANPKGPVNGFVYGEALDPTNLYKESMGMYKQQVELEAKLDRLDNIQVVNSFYARKSPTGPNLLLFLFIGGAVSFVVGLIISLLLEIRRRA